MCKNKEEEARKFTDIVNKYAYDPCPNCKVFPIKFILKERPKVKCYYCGYEFKN